MIRPYRRRLIVAASLGMASALLVAACSSNSSAKPTKTSSTASGPELTHITVGVLPVIGTAAFFIALKDGYFKREGLTVKYKTIQKSIAEVGALMHGDFNVISGNYTSFMQGEANGSLKVSIVADAGQCTANELDVLTLPKSNIKKPADLAGKTVAVNLTKDIQTLTINALLKANNVNPASVTYVEIKFPDMGAALAAKRVDAIASQQPFITAFEKQYGAVSVLDQCQGPTANLPLAGYYASASWVQKYPKTAMAFQKAIQKASAAADANRKLVDQVLTTYTTIPASTADILPLPDFPSTLDTTQLQRVANLMYSGGLLKTKFNVGSMVFHPGQ